ncbi:hypothetical protein BHE74_00046500 [Ensete ventricosum]|nr:hypothetical protein BHE74_00046500 [Ensete ventricosum]
MEDSFLNQQNLDFHQLPEAHLTRWRHGRSEEPIADLGNARRGTAIASGNPSSDPPQLLPIDEPLAHSRSLSVGSPEVSKKKRGDNKRCRSREILIENDGARRTVSPECLHAVRWRWGAAHRVIVTVEPFRGSAVVLPSSSQDFLFYIIQETFVSPHMVTVDRVVAAYPSLDHRKGAVFPTLDSTGVPQVPLWVAVVSFWVAQSLGKSKQLNLGMDGCDSRNPGPHSMGCEYQ